MLAKHIAFLKMDLILLGTELQGVGSELRLKQLSPVTNMLGGGGGGDV